MNVFRHSRKLLVASVAVGALLTTAVTTPVDLAQAQTANAGTATPATNLGTLTICKVAGNGVSVGTSFTFNFSPAATSGATSVTVTAGPAPNGNCVVAGSFPLKTKVTVTEQIPSGDYVTAIRVTPSSSEISGSANLTTGTVKARINGATTVTYTDVGSGTLKICKVAGMGVSVGTPFTFSYTTVSGSGTVTVPAGPAPGGYCVVAGTSRYGAYTVTENATSPPTYVTGITAVPPGTANGMTYTGKLGVGVTEVTYTDQSVPLSQTGYLEICKQLASGTSSTITNVSSTAGSSTVTITTNSSPATFPSNLVGSTVSGADIPVGTVVDGETPTTLFLSQPATATSTTETLTFGSTSTIFTFSVNGQTVSVPAGACSPAIEVLAGSETVSETPVSGSGYAIVGCSTIPASNCAPVGDTVTVTVAAGGVSDETILTVTNGKLLWFTNNGDSSLGAINPTTGAVSNYTGTGIEFSLRDRPRPRWELVVHQSRQQLDRRDQPHYRRGEQLHRRRHR